MSRTDGSALPAAGWVAHPAATASNAAANTATLRLMLRERSQLLITSFRSENVCRVTLKCLDDSRSRRCCTEQVGQREEVRTTGPAVTALLSRARRRRPAQATQAHPR